MGLWSDLREKHKWRKQERRERRRERWETFKKRLTCKHDYVLVKRTPMVERTINEWTGKSWISDRWVRVVYRCSKCGKRKQERIIKS